MNNNILDIEGVKPKNHEPNTTEKQQPQEEDVQCTDTKIWIWDRDQYEQFESDYLNQIYPYKISKKTMTPGSQFIFHFLGSSLHYWIQLVQNQQQEEGKLGIKDIKFLQEIFKEDTSDNWIAFRRWGMKFNKKNEYLKHEEVEQNFIEPQGEVIHTYSKNQNQFIITKYYGNNKQFVEYKKRFQVLFLFYIDGVSFVDEQTQNWIYYVIYKINKTKKAKTFVGVLSKYVFKLSTTKERHRISQVFILPTFQKTGHGKQLLDVIYKNSLEDQKCFEITTEIPSFQYQCLRDFKQCQLLLSKNIFDLSKLKKVANNLDINNNREILLTKENVRLIKESIKIPGHQIERIANLIIYAYLQNQEDNDMAKAYFEEQLRQKIIVNRSPFKTRQKLPHITFFGEVPNLKQFMIEKAKQDVLRNQDEVQQILTQTLNGFNRVISKLKKYKLIL